MKNSSTQRPPPTATPYNIDLVKYQNPKPRDIYDLTTIHSLLIDQNDKFIKLKQLIVDYNNKQTNSSLNRPHFDRQFIAQLYKMLCEVTRICHYENQQNYLNKIYRWAFRLQSEEEEGLDFQDNFEDGNQGKIRPTTASTRTRPYSAHTRKGRPDSGVPTKHSIKQTQEREQISKEIMSQYPKVDFKQLKYGQKQFYQGHRTIHPELQKPKIRLKQYHRKVLYNEDEDQNKFQQFFEEDQKFLQIPFHKEVLKVQPQIKLEEQAEVKLLEGDQLPIDGQLPKEGQQQPVQDILGQEVNIDDLVGDQEGLPLEDEEQEEVVDKLKPKVRPYQGDLRPMTRNNAIKYHSRLQNEQKNRNKLVRNVMQDQRSQQAMKEWAMIKSKVKSEHQRRSQSARLINKHPGMLIQDEKKQNIRVSSQHQIIDFSQPKVCQTQITTKPRTVFKPESQRVYKQKIQGSVIAGKLNEHLQFLQKHIRGVQQQGQKLNQKQAYNNWIEQNRNQRTVSVGVKPKKKTFEQILREAQQKVIQQTNNEIDDIKQKLTMNKIVLGGNKIQKSLSYHLAEIQEGDFIGQITGKSMLNNPFFKVAKKKKKKKKKK